MDGFYIFLLWISIFYFGFLTFAGLACKQMNLLGDIPNFDVLLLLCFWPQGCSSALFWSPPAFIRRVMLNYRTRGLKLSYVVEADCLLVITLEQICIIV